MQRVALPTGVELDVATAGDPAQPAIILLHGFPESHRTWRRQIPELAQGHFVIAPDQRGYARSSKPAAVSDYAPEKIIADVIALADHFGLATFTLVGHDWGGAIAWMAALARPDRIVRLVILNAPHPLVLQKSLLDDPAQRRASRYITTIRTTRLDRSPLVRAVLGNAFVQRLAALALGAERAAHLDEWSQPGALTGMLNWYRASGAIVPAGDDAVERPAWLTASFPRVTQPTLVIWGMRDRYLLPVQLDGLPALVADLTIVRIDAGHFVTWGAADAVNAALRDWLRTR